MVGPADGKDCGEGLRAVRLSRAAPEQRRALLRAYERDVYARAFPDEEIRENPQVWLDLLEAEGCPDPPMPLLEVILLVDGAGGVVGGVTVEFYRAARAGLLTYIAMAEAWRERGLGAQLLGAAQSWLAETGGTDVPAFGETERIADAADEAERKEIRLRLRRLAGFGAVIVDFDYVMPPLRPGLLPRRLHLLTARGSSPISSRQVAALITELAAALRADLNAHRETRAMMASLAEDRPLALRPIMEEKSA